MNTKQIGIIIPAYNEELTIKATILDFYNLFPNFYYVIVNNNSTDQTEKIALECLQEYKISGCVLNEKKQGKGYAVRKAFQMFEFDYYILVDADTTYKASDLPKMLEAIEETDCDMIVGDRHFTGAYKRENKRPFHNFGNNFVKKVINFLFRSKLNDIMSGYRVLSKRFVKNYPILATGFDLETEMTLHALDKRFDILEIPIQYTDRPSGSFSKLNTFKDGIKVLKTILWIFKYYKPFIFFGAISIFFFLSGLLAGLPVLIEFYYTRKILHIPLAILASGLMVMSLISFSIGLVLDTIVRFHKQDFELRLNGYK